MYVGPITEIVSDVASEIIKDQEDSLVMQIKQDILYDIDKEELIKALKYDRQQYEKGYQDGLKHLSEDTVTDWMVEFIQVNGIKCLMELVMQAIEKERRLVYEDISKMQRIVYFTDR